MDQRMMNRMDNGGEAKLHYGDGDFEVVRPGAFVRCAVTGEPIALDLLRYWNVERQEAYRDAGASLQRELDLAPQRRK